MKSYQQFISESVNVAGDFNGNLYINSSQSESQPVGEEYVADFVWEGSIYRLEITSNGMPSKLGLAERLQTEYPGAIVHQIYPAIQKTDVNISSTKRYHPGKLEWL